MWMSPLTEGVEDVEDVERRRHGGHVDRGGRGGEEGSNIDIIVLLCDIATTLCTCTYNSIRIV